MMTWLSDSQIMPLLFHHVWQGMLIFLLVFAAFRLLPHSKPATRHHLWVWAFGLTVTLPIIWLIGNALSPAPTRSEIQAESVIEIQSQAPYDIDPSIADPTFLPSEAAGSHFLQAEPVLPPAPPVIDSSPFISIKRSYALTSLDKGLLALWLFGFLVGFGRVVFGLGSLLGIKRRSQQIDGELSTWFSEQAARMNLKRPVSLRQSADIASPMVAGFLRPQVLLPENFSQTLNSTELQHVLSHELGHVKRRDDWLYLLLSMLQAVCFYNPALYLMMRAMAQDREMACDDWAIRTKPQASGGYARCLLRIYETTKEHRHHSFAMSAVRNGSQLAMRIDHLLNSHRRGYSTPSILTVGLSLVPLIPLLVLSSQHTRVPNIHWADQETLLVHSSSEGFSRTISIDSIESPNESDKKKRKTTTRSVHITEEKQRLTITTDDYHFDAQGEVDFDDVTGNLINFSADSHLTFKELVKSSARGKRKVKVTVDGGGNLHYSYWEDSRRQPFDQQSQQWFQETLKNLFRDSGYRAETRIPRMLEQLGPEAVVTYITETQGNYAWTQYLKILIETQTLNPADWSDLLDGDRLRRAGDYHLSQIALHLLEYQAQEPELGDIVQQISQVINSDYHRSQVVRGMIGQYPNQPISPELIKGIASDYHRWQIIEAYLDHHREPVSGEWMRSMLDGMASDHHRQQALDKIREVGLSRDNAVAYLDLVRVLSSDYHKSSLLISFLEQMGTHAHWRVALEKAVKSISSEHHRRQVNNHLEI